MEEHVCCHLTASKRQQTVFVLIPLRWRFSPIGSALSRIFQRKSFSIGEARGGGGPNKFLPLYRASNIRDW